MLRFFSLIILVFIVESCASKKAISLSDPLDSGREFIDASLKGDYDKAKAYMLLDSTNLRYLESLKGFNDKSTTEEKQGLKNANIIINSSEGANDSTTIINYTNTFKNKPMKIKVVRKMKDWLVDFKYTFSGE